MSAPNATETAYFDQAESSAPSKSPSDDDVVDLSWSDEGPSARVRDLWPFLRPYRGALVAGVALAVAGAAVAVAQPIAMMWVVNATLLGEPIGGLIAFLGVLLVLDAIFSGLQSWVLLRAGESVVLGVRTQMLERVLLWRPRTLRSFRRGDLTARLGNDSSNLRAVLGEGTVEVVGALLTFVGAIVLMVIIDPLLFVVSTMTFLTAGVAVATFLSRITTATAAAQQHVGKLSADLDRALAGQVTVITSGMRQVEADRLCDQARAAYDAGVRAAKWDALVTPVLLTGANAAFLVVFGLGGARVASGDLGLAEFVSFVLYFGVLIGPVLMSFQALTTIQRGLGSVHRLNEVLDEPLDEREESPRTRPSDAVADEVAPESIPSAPLSVSCSGIVFSHDSSGPAVLDGYDLKVAAGSVTAIMGPSGAGKTSLLHLICGVEEPSSGAVALSGMPLTQWPLAMLRERVALVQQESPIFWGSLRENLTYGLCRVPSEKELLDIGEALGLAKLLQGLPSGLDSRVEDHGVSLSGGERQRIAIARALLRQPSLLLLDEPTSALDPDNERKLLAYLRATASTCTVLLATHRATTAELAEAMVELSPSG